MKPPTSLWPLTVMILTVQDISWPGRIDTLWRTRHEVPAKQVRKLRFTGSVVEITT